MPQAARGSDPAGEHDRDLGDLGCAPPGDWDRGEGGARRPGACRQCHRAQGPDQYDDSEVQKRAHGISVIEDVV